MYREKIKAMKEDEEVTLYVHYEHVVEHSEGMVRNSKRTNVQLKRNTIPGWAEAGFAVSK